MATSNDLPQVPAERLGDLESSSQQEFLLRDAEIKLRMKELALKEIDVRRSKWRDPLFLAIIGAVLTALTGILLSFVQNSENRKLAQDKLSSDLILEWSKTSDPELRKNNLLFFIDAGMIKDPQNKIRTLIDKNQSPSLTPEEALANALGDWGRPHANFADDLKKFYTQSTPECGDGICSHVLDF